MSANTLGKKQWRMIHRLAAELAQRRVDDNLVKTAAAYLKAYPDTDFDDWLFRLVQLGELFGSSNQTHIYRHELWAACQRLEPQPESSREWGVVLAWAARMQGYYETDLRRARAISNVADIRLPKAPAKYQPPVQKTVYEDPDPTQPVSKEAEDILSKFQSIWGSREEDD